MKRILFVIQTPTFGGPHNQALRLSPHLTKFGWETVVLLPQGSDDAKHRLETVGIRVIQTTLHRIRASFKPEHHISFVSNFRSEIRNLASILQDENIQLVQIAGVQNFHGAFAARLAGIPLVWQLLSTYAPFPLRLILSPFVIKMADAVMSTGTKVAHAHPGISKLGRKVITFYPPVDTKTFSPDQTLREKSRHELGVPSDAILVGTIGNFSKQKQHEVLVKASSYLINQNDKVYVRIMGAEIASQQTYYQNSVKDLAVSLGLTEQSRLQFFSPGNRVAEFLPALDIFVLTSRAEGIPTAILEAMACELPIVSTNVGSVSEIVNESVGKLISSSPKIVSEQILELIQSPETRKMMGKFARDQVVSHYSLEACIDAHLKAYQIALSGNWNFKTSR